MLAKRRKIRHPEKPIEFGFKDDAIIRGETNSFQEVYDSLLPGDADSLIQAFGKTVHVGRRFRDLKPEHMKRCKWHLIDGSMPFMLMHLVYDDSSLCMPRRFTTGKLSMWLGSDDVRVSKRPVIVANHQVVASILVDKLLVEDDPRSKPRSEVKDHEMIESMLVRGITNLVGSGMRPSIMCHYTRDKIYFKSFYALPNADKTFSIYSYPPGDDSIAISTDWEEIAENDLQVIRLFHEIASSACLANAKSKTPVSWSHPDIVKRIESAAIALDDTQISEDYRVIYFKIKKQNAETIRVAQVVYDRIKK